MATKPKPADKPLRERMWTSQDAALRDLAKAHMLTRGDDYELREVKPDEWRLVPLEGDAVQDGPAAPKPQRKAAKPKAVHPAEANDRDRIAKAVKFAVVFVAGPKKRLREDAATVEAAGVIALRMNAEHGKHGQRAVIYAVTADGKQAAVPYDDTHVDNVALEDVVADEPEAQPEAQPALALPGALDLSPLPTAGGPYGIRLAPEMVRQNSVVTQALDYARRAKIVLEVLGADGAVLRRLDPALAKPLRSKESNAAASPRASTGGRERALTDIQVQARDLALRKQGVKRTELTALNDGVVINWKGFLERIGKRENMLVTVDKQGPTPIYFLVKR